MAGETDYTVATIVKIEGEWLDFFFLVGLFLIVFLVFLLVGFCSFILACFLGFFCQRQFFFAHEETFGVESRRDGIPERATNIIDIAKDREEGTQDVYVPLYFEEATKRLRNSEDEFLQYTWERKMIAAEEFMPIDDNAPIPF